MTTIYGWDMSHYDAPNIGTAVKEGYQFITHKAGGDALDNEYDDWWGYAKSQPNSAVLLGAYWVLYPGNPAGRADRFLERLDAASPGWRARDAFILQVDCEKWNGNSATVPSKAEIQAFCDRLVSRTGGKYRPVVYAPKWVYGDSLAGLKYPIWSSWYTSGSGTGSALYAKAGGDSGPGWKAYSGQVPAIWQFTSSARIAGQDTCDANAFRGPLSSLKSLVTPSAPPITPPAGRPTMKITSEIPVLREGDDDDKLPGYNLIVRMQRIVGVPDDGKWGPHTTAGIADWCDIQPAKAKVLTEDIYRKVFGAGR
jgi:GH25 family lysozyme M1 (1,4-beta-N-acetylmuramidase)